eukprot:4302388-Pyramimonas_sp.AAC.1
MEGRRRLVGLVSTRETAGTRPRQWTATLGALAPKPAGGDGAPGVLPLPVKLWGRARASPCRDWSDSLGAH